MVLECPSKEVYLSGIVPTVVLGQFYCRCTAHSGAVWLHCLERESVLKQHRAVFRHWAHCLYCISWPVSLEAAHCSVSDNGSEGDDPSHLLLLAVVPVFLTEHTGRNWLTTISWIAVTLLTEWCCSVPCCQSLLWVPKQWSESGQWEDENNIKYWNNFLWIPSLD